MSLLTRHLETCPECAAFAADLDRLQALARDLPRPEAPAVRDPARSPRRASRKGRPVAALAVGAGVLLVVGSLWLVGGLGSIGSGPIDSGTPLSVLEAQEVDLLAAIDHAHQVWTRSSVPYEELSWLDLPVESSSYTQLPRTDLLESQLYLDLEPNDGVTLKGGGIP
jgi:anti-sigma factor RsiW